MGKRKSYKRRSEFKNEKEMLRLMRRYHDEVVRDLLHSNLPPYYRHHDYDYPFMQTTHVTLGSCSYLLTTTFNDYGDVIHQLEKVGATRRLVRKKPMVPLKCELAE